MINPDNFFIASPLKNDFGERLKLFGETDDECRGEVKDYPHLCG
jgi:hypothetical protein